MPRRAEVKNAATAEPPRNAMKGGCVTLLDGRRVFGGALTRSLLRREEREVLGVARRFDRLTYGASFDALIRLDTVSGLDEG